VRDVTGGMERAPGHTPGRPPGNARQDMRGSSTAERWSTRAVGLAGRAAGRGGAGPGGKAAAREVQGGSGGRWSGGGKRYTPAVLQHVLVGGRVVDVVHAGPHACGVAHGAGLGGGVDDAAGEVGGGALGARRADRLHLAVPGKFAKGQANGQVQASRGAACFGRSKEERGWQSVSLLCG
jgi:hypothetical protein